MSDVEARGGGGRGGRTGRSGGRSRRGRVGPAAMSRIGLVLAAAAAVWFTEGRLRGAVCGAALLGAVLVTDLVAERLREGRRDRLDVWLSVMLGRLREYVVYAGLAIGGTVAGVADAWAWAAGALIVLALRDTITAARQARTGEPEWTPESGLDRPIDAVDPSRHPDDGSPGDPSLTAELLGGRDGGGEEGRDDHDGAEARPVAAPPTGAGAPADIRTVPRGAAWPGWDAGRAETLHARPADEPVLPGKLDGADPESPGNLASPGNPGPETPGGAAAVGEAGEAADTATAAAPGSADQRRGGPARASAARTRAERLRALPLARLAAFPQAARFGVVALTITIWDARVTFIALIVGCALAITGELAGGPARDTAR